MDARILVVEDDASIGAGLASVLAGGGHQVEWVKTGADALARADADLVLLDLGLPDLDGVEVCRRLRAAHPGAAIVILTARHDEVDIVLGLDAGADDYLTKPFRLSELLARVRAQLRRTRPGGDDEQEGVERDGVERVGDLAVERHARRAFVAGAEIELRPKEFDLLALLAAEAGRVVTRERIMSEVWDEHWFGPTKTLDTHVSALRRKLSDAGPDIDGPVHITTLRGVGYRLELP